MHTHDMENHDNIYANEGSMVMGETPGEARNHAIWAVGAIAMMIVSLGVVLILT